MALRLGLVGRGRWGQKIERTLHSFPDVEVIIIGRGEDSPARLDGVLIATQSATHAETALPYIEAGIATFIEKPMATTVSDVERIREAARRSGAVVFVGHIFLYHPAFLEILKLLPTLGVVQYLLCQGMNDRPRTDSSVLWDWLPHDLSMARAILGRDPSSVAAWSLLGGSIPQAAVSKFQFGETPVVSMISWNSSDQRRQLTVVSESATLVFDDKADRQLTLHRRDGTPSYPAYTSGLPLTLEMAEFLKAVQSGKAAPSHIADGMAVARAIAAAEKSVSLGGDSVPI
jgi:UDP-N-acetylglucosamine 3-dehydrogenase